MEIDSGRRIIIAGSKKKKRRRARTLALIAAAALDSGTTMLSAMARNILLIEFVTEVLAAWSHTLMQEMALSQRSQEPCATFAQPWLPWSAAPLPLEEECELYEKSLKCFQWMTKASL